MSKKKEVGTAKILVGGMPYFKFSREELAIFAENDLSKTAWLLYHYMRLNCDLHRGISHRVNCTEVAKTLGRNRRSILRASRPRGSRTDYPPQQPEKRRNLQPATRHLYESGCERDGQAEEKEGRGEGLCKRTCKNRGRARSTTHAAGGQ